MIQVQLHVRVVVVVIPHVAGMAAALLDLLVNSSEPFLAAALLAKHVKVHISFLFF